MSPNPFSPANTAKVVHSTLTEAEAAIPKGHTKALIIDGTYNEADGPGVRVLWVQRAPKGWNVVAEGAYTGEDGLGGAVKVAKSWK